MRGTRGILENWINNFKALPSKWITGGNVHSGFKKLFLEIWDNIQAAIADLKIPLYYTGHRLGGALATLAATIIPPCAVYTFGSPRVGNARFKERFSSISIYRIATPNDIVTNLPPAGLPFGYVHVGKSYSLAESGVGSRAMNKDIKALETNNLHSFNPSNLFVDFVHNPPYFLADHSPINYTAALSV